LNEVVVTRIVYVSVSTFSSKLLDYARKTFFIELVVPIAFLVFCFGLMEIANFNVALKTSLTALIEPVLTALISYREGTYVHTYGIAQSDHMVVMMAELYAGAFSILLGIMPICSKRISMVQTIYEKRDIPLSDERMGSFHEIKNTFLVFGLLAIFMLYWPFSTIFTNFIILSIAFSFLLDWKKYQYNKNSIKIKINENCCVSASLAPAVSALCVCFVVLCIIFNLLYLPLPKEVYYFRDGGMKFYPVYSQPYSYQRDLMLVLNLFQIMILRMFLGLLFSLLQIVRLNYSFRV